MTTLGQPIFYPASPAAIRDGVAAVLEATGYFRNVFRQKTTPTKDHHTPFAAVFLLKDDTEPTGDANVGTPSFNHTLTLAVNVVLVAITDDALTDSVDDLCFKTRAALLCDNDWRQLFEGIERCTIHPSYVKEGNSRTVNADIEIVVTFRSVWPPYLPNTLKTVTVTAAPQQGGICGLCRSSLSAGAAACGMCGKPVAPPAVITEIVLETPACPA